MLSKKMQKALNDQLNAELSAYYTYLSMSAYFEDQNLRGFAAWMRHHSDEEMVHAMKIYDFINERRGRVNLLMIAQPKTEWDASLAAFEDALAHEKHVTQLINDLVDLSIKESDHATNSFLQWFVDEQVEEEAVVDAVIEDLKRVGDFGPGLFLLDRELSSGAAATEAEAT
jgi:ferritin